MKVAILTDLKDWSSAYSISHVVAEQSRLLRHKGIPHEVFIPRMCDTREMPADIADNVTRVLASIDNTYFNQSEAAPEGWPASSMCLRDGDSSGIGYVEAAKEYDVVIVHDLLTSSWHLQHNLALRALRAPRMLAWCHSMPTKRNDICLFPSTLRFKAAPGWTYVFPNTTGATLATEYIEDSTTAVCYNPRDVRSFYDFSRDTCDLVDQCRLFEHDFMQVYAFSLPRWRSKGVPALLKLFSKMRHNGNRVKLVLANAHANNGWADEEVRKLTRMAALWGLRVGEDLFLTSQLRKEWRTEVPHRVVKELMLMSNLFVFPSETECCSLIQAEAVITGKLVVLNSSFLPMFEFANEWGFRFAFSEHDPETDDFFYEKVARNLMEECHRDSTFVVGTKGRNEVYNRDWIWTNQLEPLLEVSHGDLGNDSA